MRHPLLLGLILAVFSIPLLAAPASHAGGRGRRPSIEAAKTAAKEACASLVYDAGHRERCVAMLASARRESSDAARACGWLVYEAGNRLSCVSGVAAGSLSASTVEACAPFVYEDGHRATCVRSLGAARGNPDEVLAHCKAKFYETQQRLECLRTFR